MSGWFEGGMLRGRVGRIMAGGDWYSRRELLAEKDDGFELARLLMENRAFATQVPVKQFTHELRFYHSLTPQLQRIMGLSAWPTEEGDIVDAVALPSGLLSALTNKLENATDQDSNSSGAFYGVETVVSFVNVLRAVLPVTRRLERLGLFPMRPRPEHGVMYPCCWAVHSCPLVAVHQFIFDIDFTGTIATRMIPCLDCRTSDQSDPLTVYCDLGKGCTVILDRGEAVVAVEDVAHASVDMETLELTQEPTRASILAETFETIRTCANRNKAVAPFASSKPQPFRLLTQC